MSVYDEVGRGEVLAAFALAHLSSFMSYQISPKD